MDESVGAGVESSAGPAAAPALHVQLLGAFALSRDGRAAALPASRKVRALIAYLALSTRPVGRSHLCELLWDVPNDPRGELRWCLSKIRAALDGPGRKRVLTGEDGMRLDLSDCFVDALAVVEGARAGLDRLPRERQRALLELFRGDFLEGLELDRNAEFGSWLLAQRRRFRAWHSALLEQLALATVGEQALAYLERWQQLAPFDRQVHERLLATLARLGRRREGEEHLAATLAMFEAEGLDGRWLRETWRAALEADQASPQVQRPIVTEAAPQASRRASIAVMPFADPSPGPRARGRIADALAHDVTTRLAKLRSMFVIAQGSTFALHERRIGPEEAGRMLNVDYVVSGEVRTLNARLAVTVELIETRSAHMVWSETLNLKPGDALQLIDDISNRIVASLAAEIETLERNRAILRPPNSLDAWEAHHRGLWHMYRFTRSDNEQARGFFEQAIRLDQTFARAYAGLSFTHFQNAFLGWAPRAPEIDRAYAAAGQSLMADDRDPAAHWAMGRALWLRGDNPQALVELERSIDLSPNFALAHYMLAFVQSQAGDAEAAITASDCSRSLSPFDPLLFAMLGSRAMALARLGRYEEAAAWAGKAAARPNAHAHIFAIAAFCNALAGQVEHGRSYAATIRKLAPQYCLSDFLEAFHFDDAGQALFRTGAARVGMA